MKVGEDSVVMMLVEPVERLKTITGGINLVALTSQNVSQQFTEDVFVVDHEDALLSHRLSRNQQTACQPLNARFGGPPRLLWPGNGQLLVALGDKFGHCAVRSHAWFGQACASESKRQGRDNLSAPCRTCSAL